MNLDPYLALLFDCDGTIADSMPIHLVAWNHALGKHGAEMPEDLHYEWAGRPTPKIVGMLNEKFSLNMPVDVVVHDKENKYLGLISTVQPVKGVLDVIRENHGRKLMAVVSGSPRESVIKTLAHLGIRDLFEVILGAEDYARGKPHPDCYLQAAKLLNVPPEKCLVFEDAELGVMAAQAAKMPHVKVDPRSGHLSLPTLL